MMKVKRNELFRDPNSRRKSRLLNTYKLNTGFNDDHDDNHEVVDLFFRRESQAVGFQHER